MRQGKFDARWRAALIGWVAACPTHALLAQTTERVSVATGGAEGDALSFVGFSPTISGDGRRVVFASYAGNLTPNVPSGAAEIYVRDRQAAATLLVSITPAGQPAGAHCEEPTLSADGRFVAFTSAASDLVPGDTNARNDIFVRDLLLGTTVRASTRSTGQQCNGRSAAAALSDDGRFVAFTCDSTNLVPGLSGALLRIYLKDLVTGVVELVSYGGAGALPDGLCTYAALSSDARFVAFSSLATNLVPGDTNGTFDVFVRDRLNGTIERVSTDSNGAQANGEAYDAALSGDGRYVVFASAASNLVAGDTNAAFDVFVKDRASGSTTRVSRGWNGQQAAGYSGTPTITRDGRFVAFSSDAPNLVPADLNGWADVFVHDRLLDLNQLVSSASLGVQGDAHSGWPSLSDGARAVAFESFATNLVPLDQNGSSDVFVHERACRVVTYCTAKPNSLGCVPAIDFSGSTTFGGPDDLHLRAGQVLNQQFGVVNWSLAPRAKPFHGGWLCVDWPYVRSPVLSSGGSASGSDCSGSYDFFFSHAYAAQYQLAAGATIFAQFVSRDPLASDGLGSSDALALDLCP